MRATAPKPIITNPRIAYPFIEGMCGLLSLGTTEAYGILKQGRVRTYCVGRRRFITHEALLELAATLERESAQRGSA